MKYDFEVGQIRHARFPFDDGSLLAKGRPVVVLGWSKLGPKDDHTVVCVPITSFGSGGKPKAGDIPFPMPNKPGSYIQSQKVISISPRSFYSQISPKPYSKKVDPATMSIIRGNIGELFLLTGTQEKIWVPVQKFSSKKVSRK